VGVFPERPNFRDIAAATGVSVPTLRHYFGGGKSLLSAHLETLSFQGAPYLTRLAASERPFAESVCEMTAFIASGLSVESLSKIQTVALTEALGTPGVGSNYLCFVFEPLLAAAEKRVQARMRRGEMSTADVRAVALQIVAPLILTALYQYHLGGTRVRPLDLGDLAESLASTIILAYAHPEGRAGPECPALRH
jgi:AcrR family transcriptional regulator